MTLLTPVTEPFYFLLSIFSNFPFSLQADTEKARASSSSRSSSRHRRVCNPPTNTRTHTLSLSGCISYLCSALILQLISHHLSSSLSASTPHIYINRVSMMMSYQSAATGFVHCTSLPDRGTLLSENHCLV